jgi:hypothetical protein
MLGGVHEPKPRTLWFMFCSSLDNVAHELNAIQHWFMFCGMLGRVHELKPRTLWFMVVRRNQSVCPHMFSTPTEVGNRMLANSVAPFGNQKHEPKPRTLWLVHEL